MILKRNILIILSLLSFVVACDDYDEFTDGGDARLRFSVDTLSFDTLFVSSPSTTKTLVVWNDAKKGVRISSVRLESGVNSLFRINVDGEVLDSELNDFEIHRGDSMFVFAETTLDEYFLGGQDSKTVEDALLFTLSNGNTCRLPIRATALNAVIHRDGLTVSEDVSFDGSSRHVIYGSLNVAAGACLTLRAGTTLYFHTGATLDVYGRLCVDGTLEEPVVLRGDRLDNLLDYLPYDNTVGRWGGVRLHSSANEHTLSYLDIHSSDFGLRVDTTNVNMNGCIVHNVDGDALRLLDSKAIVTNSQFSNAHGHCVAVYGGESQFWFCTLAQFYPWKADRGSALFIADGLLDIDAPIRDFRMYSCLLTGYADDVIMGDIYDPANTPYLFDHCVLRTPKVDDEAHYVDVVWELAKNDSKEDMPLQASKQFKLFDIENFIYDYRPLAGSIAVSVGQIPYGQGGDDELLNILSTDRLGVERSAAIDAGCYQHVEDEEETATES